MTDLKKLLKLVEESKHEEAKVLVDNIRATIDVLDDKLTKQEAIKLDVIKTRDDAKSKIKEVASIFGVSEDDDLLKVIKAKKHSSKSDDMLVRDNEIANLKEEIVEQRNSHKNKLDEINKNFLKIELEKQVQEILPKHKTKVTAYTEVINKVLGQASFNEGKVVFKNKDGTERRANGREFSLDDFIVEMKTKEIDAKESVYFNIDIKSVGFAKKGGILEDSENTYLNKNWN